MMLSGPKRPPNFHVRFLRLAQLLAIAAPLLFLFGNVLPVSAMGFGISPPYVKNDSLTRNSHYEQKITLVRGDPTEDLKVSITTNVPGANDWISVDRGTEFIMPKGETQVPITVSVNVPDNAAFKDYKGYMRIVVSPLTLPNSGTVGISIGAQADIDLNVTDRKIIDFKVINVTISDAETGHTFWWMHFPGKIQAHLTLQNIGNVRAAPAKIVLDISDLSTGKTLEETQNFGPIEEINPFETKTVTADIPTTLPAGSYHVAYKLYKDATTVIDSGNLDLAILAPGTIPGYVGFGFPALPLMDKLITVGIVVFIILLVVFIIRQIQLLWGRRRRKKHGKVVTVPPPRPGG